MSDDDAPRRAPGPPARGHRDQFAQTWWSRRFLAVLESFGMGSRLQRGKRYARAGHVLSLSLSSSLVLAQVQGSRPEPYRVRIAVRAFRVADWERVERELAGAARFAAKLLAGELPADIEDVFASLGLTLFPDSQRDLSMDCSCPDWEVPCKHLAATCYRLAEAFDADPFQIFAWRGRGRTELLGRLGELRGKIEPAADAAASVALGEVLAEFWRGAPLPSRATPLGPPVTASTALPDQLNPLPITVRGRTVVDLLRPAYLAMAELAQHDSGLTGVTRLSTTEPAQNLE